MTDIQPLLDIMSRLRDPESGCPWDQKQTYRSIVPHTLEEAYEVADTIERGDFDELRDELGDLLFQIVFYAQLAKEESRFEFIDVVEAISDKLIRRHPHVFADMKFTNAEDQTAHWEATKAKERQYKEGRTKEGQAKTAREQSQLDGVVNGLPALSLARKLQSRAARVGFDWPSEQGVFAKLDEEAKECREAWNDDDARSEELGDLLFTCVNLSRHADVDPEQALRLANKKFEQRFRIMESLARQKDLPLAELSESQWETLWLQAKNTVATDKQ
ncbi:Nucleoside triphosphate pyrophosphohydrolase MazG [hydrothermal vent metagenome]|uniref:Nucleoside triphosphate pyrophosphohydrolase MazG n=1 Tax=hydrothermal vent metagenome TaxID=652676 RepID=A0A3B1ALB7_9ZZZZ